MHWKDGVWSLESAGYCFGRGTERNPVLERGEYVLMSQPRIVLKNAGFGHPFASSSTTNSTASRVPSMTGLPASSFGSTTIRSRQSMLDYSLNNCEVKMVAQIPR